GCHRPMLPSKGPPVGGSRKAASSKATLELAPLQTETWVQPHSCKTPESHPAPRLGAGGQGSWVYGGCTGHSCLLPDSLSPAGCSEAALPGGPMPVVGSGGAPTQDLRLLKRRPASGKHYACSSYGCKLAFPSMQELMDHLKVHYRPTQSLEGKTFQCPTLGCVETFPSMQDLMAHMKVHYKPNRYFKCENCLLRFRTHRSLFKHLHVCSDRAGSPAPPQKAEKPVPLPELPSSLEAMPLVSPAPHPFPLLEPNLFGPSSLTRFSGPPPSSVPFLSYVHPSPYGLPPPPAQPRLRPFVPSHGPPVSNAIWKKSQGEGGERPLGGCDVPQSTVG
uniref:Zinc finger protein 414 n=1 Tax=Anas platyrhynchos platyrhynchos TaxID=8840 RepID=A0A493SZ84_ANAPP